MLELYALDVSVLNNDSLFSFYYDQISSFRQQKINQFKFRDDKNLSLGAGIILNAKLESLGLGEKDVCYKVSSLGKPTFSNKEDLHFSISHSGCYSIVAFSDFPVGCDVQENVSVEEKARKLCLSDKEFFALNDDKEFFKLWTLKESYLKATGLGMSKDMRSISILENNEYFYKTLDAIPSYTVSLCYDKQLKNCGKEIKSIEKIGKIQLLTFRFSSV